MNPGEVDDLPSRPFKGFDWSEHADVSRLIDSLYDEYAVRYKDDAPGKRIRDPDKIKQHLTHFVLEAHGRTGHCQNCRWACIWEKATTEKSAADTTQIISHTVS